VGLFGDAIRIPVIHNLFGSLTEFNGPVVVCIDAPQQYAIAA
jgi:hypothetical protein